MRWNDVVKDRVNMNILAKITLTPALSHPMGEGESSAVSLKCRGSEFVQHHSQIVEIPHAVPSPVRRERIRMKAIHEFFTGCQSYA